MDEAVLGIVYDADRKKVLLIKRKDTPIWVLPGGGIDHGETPEQAVVREVSEETGMTVTIWRKGAEYTPLNRYSAKTHVFECQVLDGNLCSGAETRATGFFSPDNFPKPFFFLHKEWLEEIQESKELICKPIHQVSLGAIIGYFFHHPIILLKFLLAKRT